jgi:hypothetical protein
VETLTDDVWVPAAVDT